MLKRILGLLGWLGVALVCAALAAKNLPTDRFVAYANPLALAGLVCTLLYILSQWREIGQAFAGRQARFGTLAAASVLVVLAIIVAINYLSTRHNHRWDLTAAKQFTLADQTTKVLSGMNKPLRVIVFAPSTSFQRYHERLDEYASLNKNFQVEYVDPDSKPAVARPYEPLVAGGTVVFDAGGGRVEKVNTDSEQALTNALIKVTHGQQNKAYFVQGHDERSVDDSDASGYATVMQYLGASSIGHDNIVLSQVRAIPADATLLVVAGPKSDFFAPEIDLLKGYLARGGKILFLLDPRDKADSPPLTNLTALLKDWSIQVDDNVVINVPADYVIKEGETVDIGALGALPNTDGTFVLAAKYFPHPLTQGLGRVTVVFRMARSVSAITEGNTNGKAAQNLIQTTASSWGETDLKRLAEGKVAREPAKGDKNGPLTLAVAVSAPATAPDAAAKPDAAKDAAAPDAPKREARIVVVGDSDFASNGLLNAGRNADLFMNAVNWLAQQEDLIAIRPRDPEDRRITITAEQGRLIFYLTVLIVPGLVLLAGVQTWWRRR